VLSIRVGIDLTCVADVSDAFALHGERYLQRVYTAREIDDCRDDAGDVDPQRLAARFAAKEAVLKALGHPPNYGLALTSIEVTTDVRGAPGLALHGRATELARAAQVAALSVSLTHERDYAAAVVVAETGELS
jgi:holo-[acyl-carrier protein] synthase